jgi:hypothetical protein
MSKHNFTSAVQRIAGLIAQGVQMESARMAHGSGNFKFLSGGVTNAVVRVFVAETPDVREVLPQYSFSAFVEAVGEEVERIQAERHADNDRISRALVNLS